MLQPKSIKKNKILIARNFYLSDLIFLFSEIIISFFIGWYSVPDILKYKKIISISIIFVLSLLFASLLIYIPSHNARIWVILWRIIMFWTENKNFSKSSKKTNTNFFVNLDDINDDGQIKLKNLIENKYKFISVIKFDGLNIWTRNTEEKKYFLDQFVSFFNTREEKISFLKARKNINFSINIDEEKDFKFVNQEVNSYIDNCKEDIKNLQNFEFEDEYFLIIFSSKKESINEELKYIKDFFDKQEISNNTLNKENVIKFLFSFFNPFENLLNDFYEINSKEKLIDLLKPKKLVFKKNHFSVNSFQGKISTINDLALNLNVGWAETFFNSNNSWIIWHLSPIASEDYEKIINAANNKVLTSMAFNKKSQYRSKKELKNIEALDELSYLLNVENYKLFKTSMLFLNINKNLSELKNDVNLVLNNSIKKEKSIMNKLNFRQIDAYKTFSFLNNDQLKENIEMVSRNIAYAWPFTFEKNIDKNSFLLGKNKKQSIIWDIWKRNFNHTNSNCIFFGTSGSGKTTTIKKIILDNYLKNNSSVIIIDPQREYQNFKNMFPISWLDLGTGKTTINPLQMFVIDYKNIERSITNQIVFFINWIKILYPNLTEEKEYILIKALKEIYNNLNLKDDIVNFPIISDLIIKVKEINFDKNYKEIYEKERIKLLEWLKINFENSGIYSSNYNGKTNLDLNSDFIIIDVKTFTENSTKENSNAFFFMILNLIQTKINDNFYKNKRKSLVIFDEVHKFLDHKNLQTLDFIFDTAKTIRKFKGSLILSTQNPSDFSLNENMRNKTNGILKNIQYKFLFNLPGDDIKIINSLFNPFSKNENFNLINEFDTNFLLNARKGESLLVSSLKKKVYFRVYYNEIEKNMLINMENNEN
ncbi:Mbov_0397 family ICE element conjugal transfer ATPase [Mycoplasma sp. 480]|uniref:Mbov_0397 family ICE element conjugal transfer ATPase n=1 Tax=Mycoplasma sp. 480 TaxID=3440155 RepID=UPI003F513607